MKGELRNKAKEKFTLDRFADAGIFKNSKPDISDIWSEQRSMHSQQIMLNNKARARRRAKISAIYAKIHNSVTVQKRVLVIVALAIFVSIFLVRVITSEKSPTSTLGVTSTEKGATQTDDGRTDEELNFDVLSPSEEPGLQSVKRKSPSGDLLFTFKDSIDGINIEVTQQKLPPNFEVAPAVELEKIATNFQATNVIRIDDSVAFHGINEKTGIQRLFTIKQGILISIVASAKVPDDSWVGYLLKLQ
jgi:hypothetical protein